jgi:hypothetical protein
MRDTDLPFFDPPPHVSELPSLPAQSRRAFIVGCADLVQPTSTLSRLYTSIYWLQ